MHIFGSFVIGTSVIARIATAQTKLGFTIIPTEVTAGQPVTVEYSSDTLSEPATIILRKGNPANLDTISALTSNATSGTYTWIPADSLADADDYALEITQGDEINYSGEFTLTGADAAAVSSAEAATSSLESLAASLTSSVSKSVEIASIQSIIASYNSSLLNLTAPLTTSSANGSAVLSITVASALSGAGISTTRNATVSSATITASSTDSAGSTAHSTTATTTASLAAGAGSRNTGTASASASTTGGAFGVIRSAPVAIVLFAVAALSCLQ